MWKLTRLEKHLDMEAHRKEPGSPVVCPIKLVSSVYYFLLRISEREYNIQYVL